MTTRFGLLVEHGGRDAAGWAETGGVEFIGPLTAKNRQCGHLRPSEITAQRHTYRMMTFQHFVRDQIAQRRIAQDEGLPRDQQFIADFRDLVLARLGLLGFAVLDARLDGNPVSMYVGVPACGSPTARLIRYVVRSMEKLAVEFGRENGDPGFARRLKAVFKRKRASRPSVSR